jgi:hypothetical protein
MKLVLCKKRHIWLPTWPALLAGLCALLVMAGFLFFSSHDFLAVTQRAPGAKMLVVESWMADNSMREVAQMMNASDSPYESLWLTGPVLDRGFYLAQDYRTYSEMSAATLQALGVPAAKINIVPAAQSQRNRTFAAARQLKDALDERNIHRRRFDLATLGVHARRSRDVMGKVFGKESEIGIIALPSSAYDPGQWASSSAGMKITLIELLAYLYEKLGNGGR